MSNLEIRCNGCLKRPDQIEEYRQASAECGVTPEFYVRTEEGTYNIENGHFMCTRCYVLAGCPTLPGPIGWKAP